MEKPTVCVAVATLLAFAVPLQAFVPAAPTAHAAVRATPSGTLPYAGNGRKDRTAVRAAGGVTMAGYETGNKRVFVGGLPFRATEDDIYDFFEGCGELESVEIRYGPDGRSAGYGFLVFKDAESVPKALSLDGQDMMGRWLRVEEADGGPKSQRKKSEKPENCTKIFMWNVPYDIAEVQVREFFADCGEITDIYFPLDRETGQIKGTCFVTFKDTESTDKAMELAGHDLGGRDARLDFARGRR